MKKTAEIILAGKPVKVRQARLTSCDGKAHVYGGGHHSEIMIRQSQSESEKRETLIHEALHLQFWFLDEAVVTAAAQELNDALEICDFV